VPDDRGIKLGKKIQVDYWGKSMQEAGEALTHRERKVKADKGTLDMRGTEFSLTKKRRT